MSTGSFRGKARAQPARSAYQPGAHLHQDKSQRIGKTAMAIRRQRLRIPAASLKTRFKMRRELAARAKQLGLRVIQGGARQAPRRFK